MSQPFEEQRYLLASVCSHHACLIHVFSNNATPNARWEHVKQTMLLKDETIDGLRQKLYDLTERMHDLQKENRFVVQLARDKDEQIARQQKQMYIEQDLLLQHQMTIQEYQDAFLNVSSRKQDACHDIVACSTRQLRFADHSKHKAEMELWLQVSAGLAAAIFILALGMLMYCLCRPSSERGRTTESTQNKDKNVYNMLTQQHT